MSAPLPLEGTNPYTGLYQTRQFKGANTPGFGPGTNAVHGGKTGPQNVWDGLNAPPANAAGAVVASDPLEEQADIAQLVIDTSKGQVGIVPW